MSESESSNQHGCHICPPGCQAGDFPNLGPIYHDYMVNPQVLMAMATWLALTPVPRWSARLLTPGTNGGISTWVLLKIYGGPQNGWFMMENPTKMNDLGPHVVFDKSKLICYTTYTSFYWIKLSLSIWETRSWTVNLYWLMRFNAHKFLVNLDYWLVLVWIVCNVVNPIIKNLP